RSRCLSALTLLRGFPRVTNGVLLIGAMAQRFFGSGPRVALLYSHLLAGITLVAWLSLIVQARVLIGSRGLLPVAEAFAPGAPFGFWEAPSLFWLDRSDRAVTGLAWLGAATSAIALVGIAP